jgi:16S rRNA (cytosine967-C5)-methyltransferase
MTPSARLSAAIEVVAAIDAERRPAADALKAWGLAHRFAGSGDCVAIAGKRCPPTAVGGVRSRP